MARWKYFTDEESIGLTNDFCFKRDRAREFYGFPIEQTCGYRSPEHNKEIGGVADSAHVKGMAGDFKAPQDPLMREKMAWAFGAAGFYRIEMAPKHIHVDTDDETKPSPAFFAGVDK